MSTKNPARALKNILSSLDDDIHDMTDAEVEKELKTNGVDLEAARERLKKRFHSVVAAPEGAGWEIADPAKHAHELERFSAYGGDVDDALEAPIEVIEQQIRDEGLDPKVVAARMRQRTESLLKRHQPSIYADLVEMEKQEVQADLNRASERAASLLDDETRQRLEEAKRLLAGEPSGDAFATVRHALGLSQSELAKLMKQRVETISRWENGRSDVRPLAWLFLFVLVDEKLEGRSRLHDRATKGST